MIQFHPNKFKELVDSITHGTVKLVNLSTPQTQGVLNLLTAAKGVDFTIKSTDKGLVLKGSDASKAKVQELDMSEYLNLDIPEFTEDILYKTDVSTAELRYVPMLHSVLFVKNKSKHEFVFHDDAGNIFNVSTATKTRGVKATLLPQFFPTLHEDRQKASERVEESNKTRNVHSLEAGDRVTLRPFADMVAEFGEVEYPIGDGKSIKLTAIIPGYRNIAFLSHAQHLTARNFVVVSVLENQEVILQDEDGVSKFTTLIDPETNEQNNMEEPIRFSRLHIIKL